MSAEETIEVYVDGHRELHGNGDHELAALVQAVRDHVASRGGGSIAITVSRPAKCANCGAATVCAPGHYCPRCDPWAN
jgi:hypothetical protein